MSEERKVWDMKVEAWHIPNRNRYRIRITTASGKVHESVGWSHLNELIRMLRYPEKYERKVNQQGKAE